MRLNIKIAIETFSGSFNEMLSRDGDLEKAASITALKICDHYNRPPKARYIKAIAALIIAQFNKELEEAA